MRPIGGWVTQVDVNNNPLGVLPGMPRCMLTWRYTDGSPLLVIGTTTKLKLLAGGSYFDITPAGFTSGRIDSVYSGSGGSYGNLAYGAGAYGVGAASSTFLEADTWTLDNFGGFLCGICTSDGKLYVWQGNTGVAAVPPAWSPTFTGSLVTSGSTAGGATTIALTATTLTGSILSGQTFVISGVTYTAQLVATAVSNVLTVTVQPPVPSTIANGTAVTGTGTQAPTGRAVVCTPERFLVVLGANSDSRQVAWASQETINAWSATANNTAGSFELATNGRLMCGRAGVNETLLWTDDDLHAMRYIGGQLVYSFTKVGDKCGIISPNAVAMVGSMAIWMGRNEFYMYNGMVQTIPCDVADFVFGGLNVAQRAKVWSMVMPQFSEVWWFFPSTTTGQIGFESPTENNCYVIYNYKENHWSFGTSLDRSCGASPDVFDNPMMCNAQGASASVLIAHESGNDYAGEMPYIESGPVELGNGDNIVKLQRLVPDELTLGAVNLTVFSKYMPTDPDVAYGPYTLTAPTNVRVSGRQMRFRFSQVNGGGWRVGTMRLGVKQGGRR
ncbi:MAG TPA: hypothetical protein VFA81_04060 [Burkholderiales bacterium]|nr:hypothetical protein [Burkholderiales bacterium]